MSTDPVLLARGLAMAAAAVIHGPRAPLSQLVGEATLLAPRIEAFMAADWQRLQSTGRDEPEPIGWLADTTVQVERDGSSQLEQLSEVLADPALALFAGEIRRRLADGEAWETPAGVAPAIRILKI
ncbi:hypothetical protein STAQ_28080 [Allostella sp. ATCC 35155]|nr:hypothetical protein STAQ_28080 [Stella sp. ATCC 35155]